MQIDIPGRGKITLKNLLLDYNGTIACDGKLIPSVKEKIHAITTKGIQVHLVTADSNGTAKKQCADLPITIQIFDKANAAKNKKEIADKLGPDHCACIGNGFNDALMFETCKLSIIVMGTEGCATKSLISADIVCKNIEDALDLILHPSRIIPTLRG